jgi:8-oxo-dGTP pyrophosphatase MutT (NUDIX family)
MSLEFTYKNFYEEADNETPDKYWGSEAAGCIFIAKDTGRLLFAHRSGKIEYEPNTWAGWGGKIDNDETPAQAVEREVEEETGFSGEYKINHIWTYSDPETGFNYYNYIVIVPHEFTPQLNWENDRSKWVEYGEWPQPLHYGLEALFTNAGQKIKQIVDLIKQKNKNAKIKEAVFDLPPAHVQQHKAPVPNQSIVTQQKIKDAYVIVGTVWEETKGEGKSGMHAVLNVIMNRAKGDISRARDEVLKPKQFSIWNNVSDPDGYCIRLAKRAADDKSYQNAVQLVDAAMKGNLPDITGGATHYYNPKKANPSWANALQVTKVIGNHVFMKPKPVVKKPQATKSSKTKSKIRKNE